MRGHAGAREGVDLDLGQALETWLAPVFSKLTPLFDGRDRKLVAAACRLADLGARLHPDHRADLVFEQVLRAPVPGMTHPERAFLAAALFARHTGSGTPPEGDLLTRILSDDRRQRAKALGARDPCWAATSPAGSAKLPGHVAAGDPSCGALWLSANDGWAGMLLGEQTAKRASTLADQLDLGLRIGA